MNDLVILLHLKLAIIRICITISLRRIPKQRLLISVSDPPTQGFLYIKKEVDYSTSFSLWCGAGSPPAPLHSAVGQGTANTRIFLK